MFCVLYFYQCRLSLIDCSDGQYLGQFLEFEHIRTFCVVYFIVAVDV